VSDGVRVVVDVGVRVGVRVGVKVFVCVGVGVGVSVGVLVTQRPLFESQAALNTGGQPGKQLPETAGLPQAGRAH